MKLKTKLILFSSLILIAGHLNHVHAVSDAELDALEKEIEQQEAKEKQSLEEEKKRRLEEKQQREEKDIRVDIERQRFEEQKRLEEEKKKNEVARQAEMEQQKKMEIEEKLKLENEKKEKFNSMMAEAKNAENSKDYDLAISRYNNVLKEFPNNNEAETNIDRINSLLKNCEAIIGKWIWFNGASMVYNADGTFVWNLFISGGGTWKCVNPENFEFYMTFPNNPQWSGPIWIVEDGQKLKGKDINVFGGEFMGSKPVLEEDRKKTFKGL